MDFRDANLGVKYARSNITTVLIAALVIPKNGETVTAIKPLHIENITSKQNAVKQHNGAAIRNIEKLNMAEP